MPLSVQQGLRFNGLNSNLKLPSIMMDSFEIEIQLDQLTGTTFIFDTRTGYTGYGYNVAHTGVIVGFSDRTVDGVIGGDLILNTPQTVRYDATSPFTANLTIFSSYANTFFTSGYLYSVTCYLNGQVVAKYNLDEGQGTTVHDTSGNGNDGTITGATWAIKKAGTVQSKVKPKKNVIPPFSDPSYSSYFGNASNISASSDGLSITATAQDTTARLSISQYPISVTPGKTYTLSGVVTPNIGRIRLGRKGTNAGINSVWSTDYNVRSISFTAQDDQVLLSADNDGANNGAALVVGTFTISNVQLEEGSVATKFEPYTLVPDNKDVSITGRKNLLDPSAWVNGRIFDSNFMLTSFTVDTVNNVVTGYASGSGMVSQKVNVTPYTDYTFNGVADNAHAATFYIYDLAGNQIVISSAYPHTFNTGANNQIIFSLYKPGSNTTAYMDISNPQLEKGPTATAFEPYIEVPDNKPAAR